MKHIIDSQGFYIGFGGSKTEIKEGQSIVSTPPPTNLVRAKWEDGQWIEGATEQEIKDSIIIPEIITRRQFKIALAFLGYNENDILNGIDQLPEPTRTIANISYKEAGTFERFNPELIFVAKTFLSLNDEQIDEIFLKGNEF